VESIARWWGYMGKKTYPDACDLLITADAGGSNSARARLWKVELQRFADRTGLTISVSHFPPGTSKWNQIEHRLFCHITENWRGRPLTDHETIVPAHWECPHGERLDREGEARYADLSTRRQSPERRYGQPAPDPGRVSW
jgi:hypothetical protein